MRTLNFGLRAFEARGFCVFFLIGYSFESLSYSGLRNLAFRVQHGSSPWP